MGASLESFGVGGIAMTKGAEVEGEDGAGQELRKKKEDLTLEMLEP